MSDRTEQTNAGFTLVGTSITIAAALVVAQFVRAQGWGWWGTILVFVLIFAATIGLMRVVERRMVRGGAGSPANRRYGGRMVFFAILYGTALLGAAWAWRGAGIEGIWLWPIAAAPAVAVFGMIWAMGRLIIEETDEFLRWRVMAHALIATGGLLAVTTLWGFFELFKLVPHFPAWASLPLFAVLLGLSQALRLVRA